MWNQVPENIGNRSNKVAQPPDITMPPANRQGGVFIDIQYKKIYNLLCMGMRKNTCFFSCPVCSRWLAGANRPPFQPKPKSSGGRSYVFFPDPISGFHKCPSEVMIKQEKKVRVY